MATLANMLMADPTPVSGFHKRHNINNPLLKILTHPATLVGLGGAAAGLGLGAVAAKTGKMSRFRFLQELLGAKPGAAKTVSNTTDEVVDAIRANRQGIDLSDADRIFQTEDYLLHSPEFMRPKLAKEFDNFAKQATWASKTYRGSDITPLRGLRGTNAAIDMPRPNVIRYTQYQDRPMRYVITRDVPMWDFDMPSDFHADEQVLNETLADALESIRRSGAGGGTLYRTPGGARYIDKTLRATPHEMHYAGAVPNTIDPYYEGMLPRARELMYDSGLMQQGFMFEPGYAARLSPKFGRRNDYVAQPVMDVGFPNNPDSIDLIKKFHDKEASLAINRQPAMDQFIDDVVNDLKGLDRKDKEAVKRFMLAKYGVPLSLLAGTSTLGMQGE